jgi:hypothetical protein
MEIIANSDLPDASKRGRAALAAAIDDLAKAVHHLTLRVTLTASIGKAATDVESAVDALRTAAWATVGVEPQLSFERAGVNGNENSIVPTVDDLKPSEKSALRENAIAARICELHDRLGGFIKS